MSAVRGQVCKTKAPPPPGSPSSHLSLGSWQHLPDHQRWPICLRFALALLNTVREPLCGWYRAAHTHMRAPSCFAMIKASSSLICTHQLPPLLPPLLFSSFLPACTEVRLWQILTDEPSDWGLPLIWYQWYWSDTRQAAGLIGSNFCDSYNWLWSVWVWAEQEKSSVWFIGWVLADPSFWIMSWGVSWK